MKKQLFAALFLLLSIPALAQVPDRRDVPRKLFDTGLFNLKTEEGQGAFTDAVVAALHAADKRWGHLKKAKGQSQLHGHAEDAALYLSDDEGKSTAVDFIGGAGGSNPQPGWIVDEPRYSGKDWLDPFKHGDVITVTVPVVIPPPPYAGDQVFDAIAVSLFADYAEAGQAPNDGMGRWFGRTVYDWIAGHTKTLTESIEKHRREWRAILGLP